MFDKKTKVPAAFSAICFLLAASASDYPFWHLVRCWLTAKQA
ncbi:hypothetical protein SD77_2130 [Bacillus badius]|uniref:Uncharacterized protein n=1 Tax=Bacillus badius TaxID=1455 RepID=A0ABR5AY70_BACBA|nr:hypothetical protein SD78_2405 [Bacillus badius]KIL79676.1 hypothetical protein SD77_2130 [Bacillus badius]